MEGEPDDIMQACFEDLVSGQGEGTGWQIPRAEAMTKPLEIKGELWGGNLAILAALGRDALVAQGQGGHPVH